MSGKDPSYYTQSKQNALQIPDIKTGILTLKYLGINPRGRNMKSTNDVIAIVIEELDKGIKDLPTKKEPSKGLKRAIENDNINKEKLLSKYEAVEKLYQELPPKYKKDLKQVFTGIENDFESRKTEIRRHECTILVAGETAAGKSSLINLLLGGTDLLPTNALGCTSTVCEIRTSDSGKKEAIGYYRSYLAEDGRKSRKPPPVMFDLSTESGLVKFQRAVQETDGEGESPYERLEVTWPFPMLEEGIVIVDTPGIGGSGNMGKLAEKYLSKSYGFIYVVNSANAGGVQKGRLQNFMRLVLNSAGDEGYNSDSTMFVCNRWDMVPDKDKEAVKHDTFEKLSKYFTALKRSQVHYMSVQDAKKGLGYGTMTQDYKLLMDLVEQLLPDSLKTRLNAHYRWLTAVLKRTIYSLKVSKVMAAKTVVQRKEELQQIKNQIERLERGSKESINYLKANLSAESEAVTKNAINALQSEQLAKRLFSWRESECPKDGKRSAADALEAIAMRVALEMNYWERENKIVTGIKEKIMRVCKRDFELMEDQIAKLEGALVDGDMKIVQDLHKSIKKQAPPNKIWRKANKASVDEDSGAFKGLGGAIASVGSLKTGDKVVKKLFSDYKNKDPMKCVAKMQDATKLFLDNIVLSKHLQDKVHTFFRRFVKGIDAVAKMIPDFLKADLELLEIKADEIGETENNLKDLFPRLLHKSHILLGQLDQFFVNYVMTFDYQLADILWDQHEAPVGSGSFADVYIAELKTARRGRHAVALKVNRDPIKENTVSDILLEDRTMRELDHPNIIRYYGATYRYKDAKRQKDMQWIMIMEVCKYTLKELFISPDVNNPGKVPPETRSHIDAMMNMAEYSRQLMSGLKYLHQKGYVHRDLKLENVLVTETKVVKLTDVGLTKRGRDIAFSIVGSPVYMAPEVLLQSQNSDHKADIYSVGIMLWEMWYGKDAADYIQQQLFGPLDKAIENGLRPSLKLTQKPPDSWSRMIEASWQYDPANRPSAEVLCRFFEEFCRDARRQ